MFQGIARWLGYGVLSLLAVVAVATLFAGVRWLTYAQTEDRADLERKLVTLGRMSAGVDAAAPRPNFVVIFFDDLGYGDIGAFGSTAVETPEIDRLADEGLAVDDFYAAASFCTPSRAGLLTGRWPVRTTLTHVVFPTGHPIDAAQRIAGMPVRLPADEILLPEALRLAGYRTAMVGKWHLGDHHPSLPNDLGFEHTLVVLYSNDMTPLPVYRDGEIVETAPADQTTLTARYTRDAVQWIGEHADGPFFLYFAHSFPHIPLHASAAQDGKSRAGLYGDVIADLDRSVGDVMEALRRFGVADDTLVIVTSDNGPWYQGSAGSVRGRKNSVFEGGPRVPFIANWPGHISPRVRSDAVLTTLDVFPTLLSLAGVPLPADRVIDGLDVRATLFDGARTPEDRPVYYWAGSSLLGVRLGPWKAHRRHGVVGGVVGLLGLAAPKGPWLFDLARDPDESYDVSKTRPATLGRLLQDMTAFEREVAENPRGWIP